MGILLTSDGRPFIATKLTTFVLGNLLYSYYLSYRQIKAKPEPLILMASAQNFESFYEIQTVFLAGGTGSLGTCVLYKLCLELPTKKMFVLVRSVDNAMQMWRRFIPEQLDAILNSGKVVLVTGNLCLDNLGIEKDVLLDIRRETTVIFNTVRRPITDYAVLPGKLYRNDVLGVTNIARQAANTSWTSTLSEAVTDNCLATLNIAKLAVSSPNLTHFVHTSSAYCNAFLPDGPVSETLHRIYDPEIELSIIATTGTSPSASKFPWPYAHAKNLAEQLLFSRFPNLPILIARPASIGSAVRSPYMGFGPMKSIPGETFWRMFVLNRGSKIFHSALGSETGTNILDETPVDWVANLILIHAAKGTRGIVHTAAGTFLPRTMDKYIALNREEGDPKVIWTSDRSVKQDPTVEFYKVMSGDWRFETGRSEWCRSMEGPLSVDTKSVDMEAYNAMRKRKVRMSIDHVLERRRAKAKEAQATTTAVVRGTLRREDSERALKL